MSRSRKAWWDTIAQERDALVLRLNYAEAPFDVPVRARKDFERKCLREARTPAERLHIQRLSTKDILVEAYAAAQPWKELLADAERRVRRMPKTSRGREPLLDGITDARRVAERVGIRPPQVGRG